MKEQHKLKMVIDYEAGKVRAPRAAELLGISKRQFRRLVAAYRQKGIAALAHGNRGRTPANRISEQVRKEILRLAKETYPDYNDCHFTEELAEQPEPIVVSRSTLRRIRRAVGQGSPRKRRAPQYRSRRERCPQAGMLLQTDGSCHDWLEGRGTWLTLVGMIDDANNDVPGACFREEEDAAGYFLALQQVCLSKGIPQAVYADRHTIFQSPSQPTVEQELTGELPRTQFGRLMNELGTQLIAAHSPQAKGRIERLWGTLQDRLVKELRKAGANDLESANRVLAVYLPKFNARFQVEAAQPGSAYVPWTQEQDPAHYFCFKYTRTVTNDNTVSFNKHRLQIPPGPQRRSYAKARVELRHFLDGSLAVFYRAKHLVTFQPAASSPPRVGLFTPAALPIPSPPHRPVQVKPPKPPRQPWKPPPDHPWRKPLAAKETK
ncbi:MAG: ISNCY family transposase [Anaerolineaceae bacterium]|nr:ISNCY family transposase [Anaerolineaceae bacterium]